MYSRHVGVADDDVEAAVALGVGVRLVAGVDDRAAAGGRRADALPDVLGPLGDRVRGAAGGVQDLAGAGVDLAADQERDQHLGVVAEVVVAAGAVVLVAAVAVAGRVGVVLEQVDGAADRLLGEALLGRLDEALEDPLPRLVVDDELVQRVALRRGVLGVGADVEVQAGAVLQEHVGAAAPADDPAEQVAGDLVGAEPALPAQRARDAVLVLEAVDPPLHGRQPSCAIVRRSGGSLSLSVRTGPIGPIATDRPIRASLRAVGLLGELLLVLGDHLLDGLHVALGEVLAAGPGPLLGRRACSPAWPWNSGKTRWAISSKLRLVASGLAHSWARHM